QDRLELAEAVEERNRFIHTHVENVGDVLAAIADFERFAIVAPPLAHITLDEHVGQEVHLDALGALSLARLAATAFHVEAESDGGVTAQLRLARARHELANNAERTRVRRRIAARGTTDRRLIHFDNLVHARCADESVVFPWLAPGIFKALAHRL